MKNRRKSHEPEVKRPLCRLLQEIMDNFTRASLRSKRLPLWQVHQSMKQAQKAAITKAASQNWQAQQQQAASTQARPNHPDSTIAYSIYRGKKICKTGKMVGQQVGFIQTEYRFQKNGEHRPAIRSIVKPVLPLDCADVTADRQWRWHASFHWGKPRRWRCRSKAEKRHR